MLLRFKKFNKSSCRCLKCEFSLTQPYILKLKGQHLNSCWTHRSAWIQSRFVFLFFSKTVAAGWYYLLFMSSPQPVTASPCVQYRCDNVQRRSYLVIQTVTQATSVSFPAGSGRGKSAEVQWSDPLQPDLLSAVSLC